MFLSVVAHFHKFKAKKRDMFSKIIPPVENFNLPTLKGRKMSGGNLRKAEEFKKAGNTTIYVEKSANGALQWGT